MPSIILHLHNEDPVVGEIDALPSPADTIIVINNPRRKDGKDVSYLDPAVTTVIWPVTRVSFIEILPGEGEEKIVSHVRE